MSGEYFLRADDYYHEDQTYFEETRDRVYDRFIILSSKYEANNTARIWGPMLVLPVLVFAALFWPTHFSKSSRMGALVFLVTVLVLPVSFTYFYDPSSVVEFLRLNNMYYQGLQYLPNFSPYYAVYPVAQVLLILIAGAGLLGYSPKGKARFIQSFLAIFAGAGVSWLQTRNQRMPAPEWNETRYFFVDQVMLGVVASLTFLVSVCFFTKYKQNIRLMHGAIILYDLYKLCCSNQAPAALLVPHIFGPPLLLAINTIEAIRGAAQRKLPVEAVFAYPQLASAYLRV